MTEQELRALDAQVAEKVMGYRWLRFARLNDAPLKCLVPPEASNEWAHFKPLQGDEVVADDALRWVRPLSTDIAAAFTVVEKMRERGWTFALDDNGSRPTGSPPHWNASFYSPDANEYGDYQHIAHAGGADLCRMICLASLQAVEAER